MKLRTSVSPLFVLILYGLVIASGFLRDSLTAAGGNPYLSVIILQILIFILPAILFCRLKGIGYSSKLNIRLFSPGKLGCVVVATMVLICGSVLIRFAEFSLTGQESFSFSLFDSFLSYDAESDFLYSAMALAVMPAITEEFVFRAILLTEYNEAGFGAVTASVVSALLSSMIFFSLEKFPIFLGAGLVYCLLTYTTGSSLTAFLCHMFFNIYGIFGEKYVMRAVVNPSNRIISLFTFAFLFLLLLFILFGELEHVQRRMGESGVPTPSYRLKKTGDGKTPDLAATEAAEETEAQKTVLSERVKLGIEAFFSPTFLLCLLVFAVAVLGFL